MLKLDAANRFFRSLFLALFLAIFTLGCGDLIGDKLQDLADSIQDSVVGEAITKVTDEVTKAGGAVAIIEDITTDISVAITEATSKALGAKAFLPAGAITAETDQPIVLSITPVEQAAPKTTSEITVGPLVEISLRTLIDGTSIPLAKAATITLPFAPQAVSEGEIPTLSHVKMSGDTPFEALTDQQVNTRTVTASTPHFSLFAVTVERDQTPAPTGPPASMGGLALDTIYAKVFTGQTTPACEASMQKPADSTILLEQQTPSAAGNDGMLQIANSDAVAMMVFINELNSPVEFQNGLDLKQVYAATTFHDLSIDCKSSDGTIYSVFTTVAPVSAFSAFELVWYKPETNQNNVPCQTGSTTMCDIQKGTAWLYWDFSTTSEWNSNSGQSRGYVMVPYIWRKVLP